MDLEFESGCSITQLPKKGVSTMKKLIVLALISFASQGFAEEEGEHMEVTAPNECCAGLPQGLSILSGWVGATGASAGTASLKDASLKAAMNKAIKDKSKAKEKKEEDKNQYEKATSSEGGALEAFIKEVGALSRQAFDNGGVETFKYTNGKGETIEYKDCVPSGPLNPNKLTCTEEKIELFTDPTDGAERWLYSVKVVEFKYNPQHYYAYPNGYYASVVDNQWITVVFENESDLAFQIRRIAGAQ